MSEEKTPFYKKKENWGFVALVLGGVKAFAAPHTIAYQSCDYLVTIGLPLLMSYFGVQDAKKYGTPSGISRVTESVKNSFSFKPTK